MILNATYSPATPPIAANTYHSGCLVRQAGQRARVPATTLSQLLHFIPVQLQRRRFSGFASSQWSITANDPTVRLFDRYQNYQLPVLVAKPSPTSFQPAQTITLS